MSSSVIPHSVFPRSSFEPGQWLTSPIAGANMLDLFDPFDLVDHSLVQNLQWLNRPEFMQPIQLQTQLMAPLVPQKYRITVDCSGYDPNSIQTEWTDANKFVVTGKSEERRVGNESTVREFKKTYEFPENAETQKMASFLAGNNQLVIEVPLKETELSMDTDMLPRIVDNIDGTKSVTMRFIIPSNVDPSKVKLSLKDRDVIFRAEDRIDQPDSHSRFHYYKRTSLPDNTRFDKLECTLDNDKQITVTAPLDMTKMNPKITQAIPLYPAQSIR